MPKSTTPKAILDALFPEPVTVAGLRLQPVTALHYLALEKMSSPLVGDGPEPTSEDLLVALLILSSTTAQVRQMLQLGSGGIAALAVDLAARFNARDLLGVVPVLVGHLNSAFATAIPVATKEGEVPPLAPASSSGPSTPS